MNAISYSAAILCVCLSQCICVMKDIFLGEIDDDESEGLAIGKNDKKPCTCILSYSIFQLSCFIFFFFDTSVLK